MNTIEPRVLPAGTAALLLDCGSLDRALSVFAVLTAARERGELSVGELVPAAETVLVSGGEARDTSRLAAKLRGLLAGAAAAGQHTATGAEVVIPVHYDGEDLDDVAALTGLSRESVVARHTSALYTVAFTGFAPGFAYLSGGDPALAVPRRSTPRPRILPGSVGLAGPFSGVYPRESPGGWQIIGSTSLALWDIGREQPAALVAGGSVRFTAERDSVAAQAPLATQATPAPSTPPTGTATLRVVDAGLQTLVQDAGRSNVAGMGVGASGAAARGAYRRANTLVGNRPGAAALELSHGGFAVTATATAVLALTGAPRAGRVSGPYGERSVPHGAPFRLSIDEQLSFDVPARGLRSVLALRGGVAGQAVLGSLSRDTLAGLGPVPLAVGDEIYSGDCGVLSVSPPLAAEPTLPAPGEDTVLRLVLGPRDDWFDGDALTRLTAQAWTVTPNSNRVGVRLSGEPLQRAAKFESLELPSEGVALGSLQVPPDGQPVIFLADRPLTGGYPVIAVVHDDDLDLAAQLAPGSRVRFTPAAATTSFHPQP